MTPKPRDEYKSDEEYLIDRGWTKVKDGFWTYGKLNFVCSTKTALEVSKGLDQKGVSNDPV